VFPVYAGARAHAGGFLGFLKQYYNINFLERENEHRLFAYKTDKGVYLQRGFFFDTRDAFEAAVEEKHADNRHGQIYRAALAMIDVWTEEDDELRK